jgi:hypothetical protein
MELTDEQKERNRIKSHVVLTHRTESTLGKMLELSLDELESRAEEQEEMKELAHETEKEQKETAEKR